MIIFGIIAIIILVVVVKALIEKQYRELESMVLEKLGFSTLDILPYYDENVIVKSR